MMMLCFCHDEMSGLYPQPSGTKPLQRGTLAPIRPKASATPRRILHQMTIPVKTFIQLFFLIITRLK